MVVWSFCRSWIVNFDGALYDNETKNQSKQKALFSSHQGIILKAINHLEIVYWKCLFLFPLVYAVVEGSTPCNHLGQLVYAYVSMSASSVI